LFIRKIELPLERRRSWRAKMLTEIRDGDAIFSNAIVIASAEERAAYIAGACGNDVALRRQVEERVAAHFQAGSSNKSARAAAAVAHPNGHNREHGSANHAEAHANSPRVMHQAGKAESTPRHGSARTRVLLVLLAAATVVSTSLAVWAMRAEKQERAAVQQAVDERKQARKAEEEAKHQRDQALAARKTTVEERERARKAEEAARRSEQDAKAVLAFFQNNLLAVGRSKGWAGGPTKNVTLRQAVDAAESQVAEAFADRPLVEASIRETLGTTYLDLGEPALAVKQCERALALREAVLGADHADTGDCRNKLAVAYRMADRTTEADRLFNQDPISSSHAEALAVRGAILLSQKKPAEAELKLRECLAIRQKIQPDDWTTFVAKAMLGEALLGQKKYADAEQLLLSGYEGLKQREAKIPSQDKGQLTQTLERLVRLYEDWGKEDKVVRWRKELEAAKAAKKT
jgi:hypothetical protein